MFVEPFLQVWFGAFASLILYISSKQILSLSTNWGTEKSSHLLEITQLTDVEAGFQAQSLLLASSPITQYCLLALK